MDASILNSVYPVSKATIYRDNQGRLTALQVIRECLYQGNVPRGDRRKITVLSESSLRKLAFTGIVTSGRWLSMLTLTYSANFPVSIKASKRHLTLALTWLKRNYRFNDYLWFAEFQRRGAIHYHLMLPILPPHSPADGLVDWARFWVRTTCGHLGDWPYHRLSDRKLFHVKQSALSVNLHWDTWQVLRERDGAARYVAKYAYKAEQKQAPAWVKDIGRWWGVSRGLVDVLPQHTIDVTEEELRQYLADRGQETPASWDIIPKYVWI